LIVIDIWFSESLNLPHFLYIATAHFAITMLVIVLGSIMTGGYPDEQRLKEVVWSVSSYEDEGKALQKLPFYKNYRYQGLALVIIVIIILLYY